MNPRRNKIDDVLPNKYSKKVQVGNDQEMMQSEKNSHTIGIKT